MVFTGRRYEIINGLEQDEMGVSQGLEQDVYRLFLIHFRYISFHDSWLLSLLRVAGVWELQVHLHSILLSVN